LFVGFPYDSGDGEGEDCEEWNNFWQNFEADSTAADPVPAISNGTTPATSSSGEPTPKPEVGPGQDNDSDLEQDRDGLESVRAGVSGERCWLELALAGGGAANQAVSDQYFADFGGDLAEIGMSGDEAYDD
jgi:hypothetical protein